MQIIYWPPRLRAGRLIWAWWRDEAAGPGGARRTIAGGGPKIIKKTGTDTGAAAPCVISSGDRGAGTENQKTQSAKKFHYRAQKFVKFFVYFCC